MKNLLLLTTALAALTATSALAGPLGVSGEMAYSVKNNSIAMNAGPDLTLGNFGLEPRVNFEATTSKLKFTGASVEAKYGLTGAVDLFGVVTSTPKWGYNDTQLGIRFRF